MSRGVKHVSKNDKILARYIKKVGPQKFEKELEIEEGIEPFEALLSSIVYQQLAGKAAAAILGRVVGLFQNFPTPQEILATPNEKLRGAGLSKSKLLAIKDLAQKTIDGVVPTSKVLAEMQDEEIIERLVSIRGVGRWTAEMLLIKIGRTDVLPTTDYGIRKAFQLVYRKRKLPSPKAIALYGEIWRPYRTVASWYLWRILDLKIK